VIDILSYSEMGPASPILLFVYIFANFLTAKGFSPITLEYILQVQITLKLKMTSQNVFVASLPWLMFDIRKRTYSMCEIYAANDVIEKMMLFWIKVNLFVVGNTLDHQLKNKT